MRRTPLIALALIASTAPTTSSHSGPAIDPKPAKTRDPRVPYIVAGEPVHPAQLAALAKKNARARQGKRGKRGRG